MGSSAYAVTPKQALGRLKSAKTQRDLNKTKLEIIEEKVSTIINILRETYVRKERNLRSKERKKNSE